MAHPYGALVACRHKRRQKLDDFKQILNRQHNLLRIVHWCDRHAVENYMKPTQNMPFTSNTTFVNSF